MIEDGVADDILRQTQDDFDRIAQRIRSNTVTESDVHMIAEFIMATASRRAGAMLKANKER